ncbi:MAG: hypothetical protein NZ473_06230 [Candidatus Kapabacteria bacterium]|nr:hypothetical protein [Candidatus Kapabacteria bacterium]MCS7170193.1 hypothetical protein [Candidatus Kapabacteria bacterium]MDW7997007.1 hypothetical protein [Bacteroidota bacterium]MDW8224667.1 hypothetical protein [Bacteroidota bacterium]
MEFLERHGEYVVLWVNLVVWGGISLLLLWVERRLQRMEQRWRERG